VAALLTPELFPERSTATTVQVFVPSKVYGAAFAIPGAAQYPGLGIPPPE